MTAHSSAEQITAWLHAWGDGNPSARDKVMNVLYKELQQIARQHLRRERKEHTLQPTALVHEAYCRLVDVNRIDWQSRVHFLGAASSTMRRILIEHARRRGCNKRGADFEILPLDESLDAEPSGSVGVLEIHDALERLAELDMRRSKLVELKFFGGLSNHEAAEALGCSRTTVVREWRLAKIWLLRLIKSGEEDR